MKTRFALCLSAVMLTALSGCITVTCADGSRARYADGSEVKANNWAEERDLANQYCPKTALDSGIETTMEVPPPAPTPPVPTNLAPALGGAVLLGGAMLGGSGSASSTTGTR